MGVLELLKNNKGTVSSALGKELAARAVGEEPEILIEAIELCLYDLPNPKTKNIRAGAAKTVEIVAEKLPGAIAPHLESLLPALSAPEPQTRWMILRTCGFCAALVPEVAANAIQQAQIEIENKTGLIVASSVDLFLGSLGAVSPEYAAIVFPLLEESARTVIKNEGAWILEAFLMFAKNLDTPQSEFVKDFAHRYACDSPKSTKARATKLLKLLGDSC
jgi:hypothetical protein